jgi:hypothetical protein
MADVCFKAIASNLYSEDVLSRCTPTPLNTVFTKRYFHFITKTIPSSGPYYQTMPVLWFNYKKSRSIDSLASACHLLSCSANSSTLKTEEIYSFETFSWLSVDYTALYPRRYNWLRMTCVYILLLLLLLLLLLVGRYWVPRYLFKSLGIY